MSNTPRWPGPSALLARERCADPPHDAGEVSDIAVREDVPESALQQGVMAAAGIMDQGPTPRRDLGEA